MNTKMIERIIEPKAAHYVGDGFRVHNFIPSIPGLSMERMSPFIMLDYNAKFIFPPTEHLKGVGVHPHKGFETVTLAYKGSVAHRDSSGGGGIIGEGDVQWMTAASGILHQEYHEEHFNKAGGEFQMVQLWVNLPAKDKKTEPKYQSLIQADIPTVALPGDQGCIEVIAGNYNQTNGAASTFTPINMMNAKLKTGGSAEFSFPEKYTTLLLVIEGRVTVNDQMVETDNLVVFKNEGTDFLISAAEDAIVLVLSGEPILEPIYAHGPFVMNTREEIIQAFDDFNKGKFGKIEH